ncbi:MAG TPA: choice-of-anchor L domain-containing protein, partial [Flavobacterium sp.]|nr:choice-of-anchor L domain-containing protein [Flavobacterium sp.]
MKKITLLFCLFFSLVGLAQTANLVVSKTSSEPIYYPGIDTAITYFVQIGNSATTDAEDVLIEIPFDASVDLTSVGWIAPDGTTGTGAIAQTIDINAGETGVYQITIDLPLGYIQGTNLIASVDMTHPTLSANLLHHITNYTYVAGADMVYTITIENQGPDDAINLEIEDIIPTIAGMDLSSVVWTGSNGTTGTGNLEDTIAVLLANQTVTYTLTLPIPDGYSQIINNIVNVTADNATVANSICFTCSHYANPQEPLAALVVTKTSPEAVYPQGITKITYFVQIGNSDTEDANGVVVSIPYHASVNTATVQWTAPDGTTGTGAIAQTIDIPSGQVAVYEITIDIPAGYVQGTSLIAGVTTIHPTITTNLSHQVTDYIYIAGTNLVYTVTVDNQGPVDAINVQVEDIIPSVAGMDLVTVVWTGSNGAAGTGNLQDTIALLQIGETVTYTITLPIPLGHNQTIVNNINVTADNIDNQGVCLGCTHYAKPQPPRAHIVTTKTNDITTYVRGTYVDYVITVTNQGPNAAQNVLVYDPLPYGITQMTWTGNGTAGIGQLNQTIPLLENGQTVIFNVQVFIPENFDIEVNLVNNVWVTTPTLDPNPHAQPVSHIDYPAVNYVTVNNSLYSVSELVNDVLIDMDCALVENISSQGFINGTNNTMGYFHSNNSSFPIKEGVVIKTGPVSTVQGPYNDGGGATNGSGTTDAQLNAIGGGTLRDVSFIEFDFTPITDELKFNFLFASNEYGTYQCSFGDVFAFILTDLTTGVSTNLAVIPGTNPPVRVAVTTIRDGAYNSGCGSENIEFFDQMNTTGDAINMKGNTVKMTASGPVIPCRKYRIKLAIGDWSDTAFDSAVFLEAGSFDIGALDLGENYLETQGTALCPEEEIILNSGLTEIEGSCDIEYEYSWFKDGVLIPGATNPTYEVTTGGVYTLETTIIVNGTVTSVECALKPSSAVVEFFEDILAGQPDDLTNCIGNNIFDLTQRYAQIYGDDLDPNDANVSFHLDMDYLEWEFPIEWGTTDGNMDNTDITAFEGTNGQVIYVRIQLLNGSPCYVVREITLNIIDCSVNAPDDIELCDNDADGSESVDLALLIDDIILGLDDQTVTFHTSQSGADNGTTDLIDHTVPYAVNAGTTVTVFARAEDDSSGLYSTTSFTITVFEGPQVEQNIDDYELCSSNTDNTAEFDLTSKTDEILAGTTAILSFYNNFADADAGASSITTPEAYTSAGETIYVKATDTNGCYSITSFELVINDDFEIEQNLTDYELCDENGDGEEEFDLTTKTTEILGTQTATLSFYTTEADAQAG